MVIDRHTSTTMVRSLTLEDEVFGIDDTTPPEPILTDPTGRIMVPLVVVSVLVGVSLWSICKSVQYSEMFGMNARYRYGLYVMNAVVIFAAVVVLCIHQQRGLLYGRVSKQRPENEQTPACLESI